MAQEFHVRKVMQRLFIMALLVIFSLLVACVPTEVEPSLGGPVPVTRERTATPFPLPTDTPSTIDVFASDTPTPFAVTTLTSTPGALPTPTPAPALPGLIYEDGEGLWRVAPNWLPELLAEVPQGAALSPDGRHVLYQLETDIWLVELATGEKRNLTEGTGRAHCCTQWWPARPGAILFGSWPADSDLGPTTGFLSTVQADGSDYAVLDEEVQSNALPGPSSDGQIIAYDRAGSAWLYRWGSGPEQLDPAAYGLANVVRLGGPSWSPDGRQLAWTAAIQDPDWRIALVIFDLETQTARLLHPYSNVGRGGWFPPPAWSPDGRWLAFAAEDIRPEANGIWVVAADGSEEIYLGPGAKPIWSPDGHWLTYLGYAAPGSGEELMDQLVEVGSWYSIQMFLPPSAIVLDWIE